MKKYFLIIVTMVVAFAFSSYAGSNIFMANSPRINRNYLADLKNQFNKNINNVYLAFSSLKKFSIKKDIAVVYPTLAPRTNNMNEGYNYVTGKPTIKVTQKPNFAQVNPTTIPANLFKSISKGVSAYETSDKLIFKIEKGATYKIRTIEVDGKKYEVIDLTK